MVRASRDPSALAYVQSIEKPSETTDAKHDYFAIPIAWALTIKLQG
jgi:hypothetical protein